MSDSDEDVFASETTLSNVEYYDLPQKREPYAHLTVPTGSKSNENE